MGTDFSLWAHAAMCFVSTAKDKPMATTARFSTTRSIWVFPKGWTGTWELHETVRKVYSIF